jgi:hypothetical protein
MLRKSRFWAVLFASLFLMGGGGFLLLRGAGHAGHVACVYVDGELERRIDLDAVAVPYDFVVETKWGHNTVHVEQGSVRVSEADCPDQICVHQGKITGDDLLPIVCVPHRVVIEIEEAGG